MAQSPRKYLPIAIDDVIISSAVMEEQFTCDLARCKGACCVEGELGAPLEKAELPVLDNIYPAVEPFLPESGRQAIREQGAWIRDITGEYSTPLVGGRECAYTVFAPDGTAQCGIELAWKAGAVDFQKPISCHLYPIRIEKSRRMEAVNYHEWEICSPACALGKKTKLRVYEFVKGALIRKYGEEFYEALDAAVKEDDEAAALS